MAKITRRIFLKGVGIAAVAAPAAAHLARAQSVSGPILDTSKAFTATHWGGGVSAIEGGRFVETTPFAHDPFPSPALQAFPSRVYSAARVRYPMVRASYLSDGIKSAANRGKDPFVRVSWNDALDLVAKELKRIQAANGNHAVFAGTVDWHGAGKLHNAPVLLRRLLNMHGGFVDSSGDFSVQAAMTVLPHVTGAIEVYDQQTAWPSVLDNSTLVVLWGADLLKNNQIGWTPADHYAYAAIPQLKQRGTRVVSIDPVKTDTAEYLGADWIAPRPNTDVALMLGIAHTLLTENLHDQDFLKKYAYGFDQVSAYLTGKSDGQEKTAAWASGITGVPEGTIQQLARDMAKSRTMIMSGWATQRQDHGEQAPWMIVTLAAMLGQIGLPGGGFGFSYHYASGGSPAAHAPSLGGIDAGKAGDVLTVGYERVLSEMLLEPGKQVPFNGETVTLPDIRMVYWSGGNPLSHQPDRNRLIEAWRRPETIVIHEPFWTLTAKYADIVLPVTTTFERNDIDVLGEYSQRGIVAMQQVIEPLFEARSDYAIFSDLADRLGFKDAYTGGLDEMGWLRQLYANALKTAQAQNIPMPDFDTFWNDGYVTFDVPKEAEQFVRYADFRADPVTNQLGTPSGRFEIYSKTIEGFKYDDCPPHASWLEPAEWLGGADAKDYPFHLLSAHPKNRLHSQLDNTWIREWEEVSGREPIWIHPDDAAPLGIENGDVVRVESKRGAFLAGAVLTERISRHVVLCHEGAWPDPETSETGALDKHGNINVATLDKGTSQLAQGNIANTVLVRIAKATGDLPQVTAFLPPAGA